LPSILHFLRGNISQLHGVLERKTMPLILREEAGETQAIDCRGAGNGQRGGGIESVNLHDIKGGTP
jgi:hypothetical protein